MTNAVASVVPPQLPRLAGGPPAAWRDVAGDRGARWLALAVAGLLALVALGAVAWLQQVRHGEAVTGMGTIGAGGVTWGLYIVFVVFFIGVSFAGMAVASMVRLLRIEPMRPFARMAEVLTIIALILGALCVMADLGQPLRGLLLLPKFARPMSPMFGTFSLVIGGYLLASLVYLFVSCRADAAWCAARGTRFQWLYRLLATGFGATPAEHGRHHRTSFWLSLTILPLLVTAHSTLGFIFGIQGGRPGWFSALQGPGFLVMAGVSGVGMLIVVAAIVRATCGLHAALPPAGFRWLGNLLMVLTLVYLYFMISEALTATYAGVAAEARIAHEVVFGAYAGLFWTVVTALVSAAAVLFAQFATGRASIGWTVAAGLLVNVAAVLKRYLIVVPSQTHGMLLDWPAGQYVPSWVEWAVLAGLLALGTLLYMGFVRVFPIVPVVAHEAPAATDALAEPAGRRRLRVTLTWGALVLGAGLAVVGFLGSARVGTLPYLDPALPFAPSIFIAGVVTCFLAAVIYEVVPAAPLPAADAARPMGEPPAGESPALAPPLAQIPHRRKPALVRGAERT